MLSAARRADTGAAVWQTLFVKHFCKTFTVARLTTSGPGAGRNEPRFPHLSGKFLNFRISDIIDHLCGTEKSNSDGLFFGGQFARVNSVAGLF